MTPYIIISETPTQKAIRKIREEAEQEKQNAIEANNAEWAERMAEAEYTTDDDGNIYHKEVGTDGEIHLVLIESYTGELFQ